VTVVLDADVLVGALDGADAHHAEARSRFEAWERDDQRRVVSAVNLSEVLVAPAADPDLLRRARTAIATLRVGIHRPSEAVAVDAARLRAHHPISLPDAYLLATTRHLEASVASFDAKVLRAAKHEGIPVGTP
jgi:predicted nucleic acid-binding protein